MVQNKPARSRGRPRSFEPDEVLGRAAERFWSDGFAATSLDALGEATGLNRPSLYAAFGDKRQLYLKALDRYMSGGGGLFERALAARDELRPTLLALFGGVLDLYRAGEPNAVGCFLIGTALTEAPRDESIRRALAEGLAAVDGAYDRLFRAATERGKLPVDFDAGRAAMLASALLHTLAIRSRAGSPRAELDALVTTMVDAILPPGIAGPQG